MTGGSKTTAGFSGKIRIILFFPFNFRQLILLKYNLSNASSFFNQASAGEGMNSIDNDFERSELGDFAGSDVFENDLNELAYLITDQQKIKGS